MALATWNLASEKKQKQNILDLSKILNVYNYIKIGIDGHASIEGESDYNLLLSNKRSSSIKDYLTQNGINESRIKINSFGEERPAYSNTPISERIKNRRAVISVEKWLYNFPTSSVISSQKLICFL